MEHRILTSFCQTQRLVASSTSTSFELSFLQRKHIQSKARRRQIDEWSASSHTSSRILYIWRVRCLPMRPLLVFKAVQSSSRHPCISFVDSPSLLYSKGRVLEWLARNEWKVNITYKTSVIVPARTKSRIVVVSRLWYLQHIYYIRWGVVA